MKNRKIALFITFIAVFMTVAMLLTFSAFAEGEALKGDVDGNGEVNSADVTALAQYFAAYDYDHNTSAVEIAAGADMNEDGKVTLVDLNLLRAELVAEPPHEHDYKTTVTEPTCTVNGSTVYTCECGATYSEPIEATGHAWANADCDTPKTCTTCGATEGEATGHAWADADCDTPKTCTTCGATEGEATGHTDANADYVCDTCSTKMFPADGEALTIPQAIAVAKAAGTTYTTQKYYVTGVIKSVANTTYGNLYIEDEAGNELYIYGLYSADGNTRYDAMSYKPVVGDELTVYTVLGMYGTTTQGKNAWLDEVVAHEHTYSFDCDTVCDICGNANREDAGEHQYTSVVTEPTCTMGGYTTHTCEACGDTYKDAATSPLGHNFVDGECANEGCDETANSSVPVDETYTFSNYPAGTQYAKNEEHVLDDNTIMVTSDAHFTTELRLYSSSTNNAFAIIKSANPITKIAVNAGNKADTLVIYGSNDEGATWTEITTIDVTSTSYTNYTKELGGEYYWIKLDVKGSNQVRIKSMTLTTMVTSGAVCEHTNTATTTKAATCLNEGTATVNCEDCGKIISTSTIAALGHDYGDWIEVTAPTCVNGEKMQECSRCDSVVKEAIPATDDHNDEDSDNKCDVCEKDMGSSGDVEYVDKSYSYTFTQTQFSANGTKKLNNVNWTLSGDGGYWGMDNNNGKGHQFGSGSKPYKNLSLVSDTFTNVTQIKINTSGASSVNATLEIYVGGVKVGTQKITASSTEYTFKLDQPASGAVEFRYTQTSSKAIYIKSITIDYQEVAE